MPNPLFDPLRSAPSNRLSFDRPGAPVSALPVERSDHERIREELVRMGEYLPDQIMVAHAIVERVKRKLGMK